jgi:hypothetical protein
MKSELVVLVGVVVLAARMSDGLVLPLRPDGKASKQVAISLGPKL